MSNLTKSIPADERKMLKKAFWRSFTLYGGSKPGKTGSFRLLLFSDAFYQ